MKLSNSTLGGLPVAVPSYDRAALTGGIVHFGLGNFHRAHQAWYTAHSPDADQWGIAAFTGRSAGAAEDLAEPA